MNIEDVFYNDLIGAVRYRTQWHFFSGTAAEWILDYAAYKPSFNPAQSSIVFRNNLLKVDETNAAQFLAAMKEFELSQTDISMLIEQRGGANNWPLAIVIDFDEKLYINGFSEIPLHEYIPPHWKGCEDFPLDHVPSHVRKLWKRD